MKIDLQQLTMNAGLELPMDFPIRYNLRNNHKFFENIYISDGNMTKEAAAFYKQFPNVHGLDLPWRDDYYHQYLEASKMTQEGSWIMHLDADELPSESLLQGILEPGNDNFNVLLVPCILHITDDDKHFYPVEPDPKKEYIGQWTKNLIFKKTPTLTFRHFGSHVIAHHGNTTKTQYFPYPYYHLKSLQSFVENDLYQAFLSPEGQGYSPSETIQFQALTRNYKTTKEFKKATKEGLWPLPLQKFAYDTRNIYDRAVSRLYWQYHILNGHPCFKHDPELTWDSVKKHVQSEKVMNLFEYNKQNKIGEIIIEKDF